MRYMILLTHEIDSEPRSDADAPADDVFDDWDAYTSALEEAGVLIDGSALHGTDTATTLRLDGGRRLIVDGPYTEAKEVLVGFYVIETTDLDTALAWAGRAPSIRTGPVEVRPIIPGTSIAEVRRVGAVDR